MNTEKEYIVYLIRHKDINEYTKIGYTGDLNKRVRSLQTASPTGIEVIRTYTFTKRRAEQVEHGLHRKFHFKNSNLEWFKLTDEDIKFIDDFVETIKTKSLNKKY